MAGGLGNAPSLRECAASFFYDQPSSVGQSHAPLGAIEQSHSEFILELADLLAQGRLRDMQALGGAAEVEFFGDRDEIAQVSQFHMQYISSYQFFILDRYALFSYPSTCWRTKTAVKPVPDSAPAGDVHARVRSQFGAAASAYTTSVGHSDPTLLRRVVELAQPRPSDRALDIATGAGHTALALAPHVAEVVAFDLTEQMLTETARNAAARGLKNVVTRQGAAERLPFPDSSFDIVAVRQAPHHYADVRLAVNEMARGVKPGGRVVIIDSRAPEDDELDRAFNHIEKLRDSSHVRNWRPSEWRAMIQGAGLRILAEYLDFYTENGHAMDFDDCTERMKTPAGAVEEPRRLFRTATPALVEALRIEIAGEQIGFCVPQIALAATKD